MPPPARAHPPGTPCPVCRPVGFDEPRTSAGRGSAGGGASFTACPDSRGAREGRPAFPTGGRLRAPIRTRAGTFSLRPDRRGAVHAFRGIPCRARKPATGAAQLQPPAGGDCGRGRSDQPGTDGGERQWRKPGDIRCSSASIMTIRNGRTSSLESRVPVRCLRAGDGSTGYGRTALDGPAPKSAGERVRGVESREAAPIRGASPETENAASTGWRRKADRGAGADSRREIRGRARAREQVSWRNAPGSGGMGDSRSMPSEASLTAEEQARSMQDPGDRALRSHP